MTIRESDNDSRIETKHGDLAIVGLNDIGELAIEFQSPNKDESLMDTLHEGEIVITSPYQGSLDFQLDQLKKDLRLILDDILEFQLTGLDFQRQVIHDLEVHGYSVDINALKDFTLEG